MWRTGGNTKRLWRHWVTRDERCQEYYSYQIRKQWEREGRLTPDDVLQIQMEKLLTKDVAQKLLTQNAADYYMNLKRARRVTRCERCLKLFSAENEVRFTRIRHNLAAIDGNVRFICLPCITGGSIAPPTSPSPLTKIDQYFIQ